MPLTVLSVAFPFAPVAADTVGGAEQVLSHLDDALVRAGHHSIVVAQEGSRVAGTLVPVPATASDIDDETRRFAWAQHRRAVRYALRSWPVDVVHMHGIDFHQYLPEAQDVPVLATLHLPPDWYPERVFREVGPHVRLNCVSASQSRACPPGAGPFPTVLNGVPVERLSSPVRKRPFALALGRICPEKGFHHAIEAARRAGIPLLLGGRVYPYEEHERYFREQVRPRLDGERRFVGPLGFARKRRLLTAARCVLIPSLAPETSSLVAMEALACGTPVIAFPAGAIPEIVEHGRTGFLVRDEAEMAEAIRACGEIDPELCRRVARERFTVDRMAGDYFRLYEELIDASAASRHPHVLHAAAR